MNNLSAAFFAVLLLCSCSMTGGGYLVPDSHPEKLSGNPPLCSSCHDESNKFDFGGFDHTPAFAKGDHRFLASQKQGVCAMCHQQSYCNDCHAEDAGMKPSAKNPDKTYLQMPHRGDYISRHRIDGRLDPASCFSCHKSPRTASSCAVCHGR